MDDDNYPECAESCCVELREDGPPHNARIKQYNVQHPVGGYRVCLKTKWRCNDRNCLEKFSAGERPYKAGHPEFESVMARTFEECR